jgi:hypothetical protein
MPLFALVISRVHSHQAAGRIHADDIAVCLAFRQQARIKAIKGDTCALQECLHFRVHVQLLIPGGT